MAKLKAHKQELLRIEREIIPATTALGANSDALTTWDRITRTYHSDGKILEKHDCRFKPTPGYDPNPGIYSYGWKVWGRVKPGVEIASAVATIAENIRAKGADAKWKIVSGGPAPVIISQARIMRAVESGESVGFCKECGNSQDGCEPDARGYRCEKCGAHAVYGAEEMLISL